MRPISSLTALLLIGLVSACGRYEDGTFGRGAPERLLDVSSEVVNLSVATSAQVDELSQWVGRDQPTRAELYCAEGATLCREARQVFDLYGVPVTFVPSSTQTATLIYERVLARDCKQAFRDDLQLWHNENHPAFGCATSANIVQHVTEKQQFVNPNLTDYRDAESAVNNYRQYQRAETSKQQEDYNLNQSLLRNAKVQ